MKGPLAGLMQKAQRMQEDMQKAQEELAQQEVTGQAGGGLVSVVMSGRLEVRRVVRLGQRRWHRARRGHVERRRDGSDLTAGMNLPPGFKMPF